MQSVHERLQADVDRLTAELAASDTEGRNAKADLGRDIRLNFVSLTDRVDTFANIESANRQIDSFNIKHDALQTQLQKAMLLLPEPYFARIDVAYPEEDAEPFYLGRTGYTTDNEDNLVYDWRSPIADLYYANRLGATQYQANGRDIPVDLKLKRQFVSRDGHLQAYFDTQVGISDPILMQALAANRGQELQDITATIQVEQNRIIRDTDHQILIVDGVAGSGKTSVMLQRVAYQLYIHRQQWQADNILILTPNQLFTHYIEAVLPALGEANPLQIPFARYVQQLGTYFGLEVTTFDGRLAEMQAGFEAKTALTNISTKA